MNLIEEPAMLDRNLEPRSMVSMGQTLAILEYMKVNPQLAHSSFSRTKEGRSQLKRHWAACADLANNVSIDCAQRTPDQWRAYYNAYKSKLKKKVKDMKAELAASGGGPAKKRLSDVENRLYYILGPDLGEELPRACRTPVSRFETEHQPSSSTAEVMDQDESNISIGSESSDVELYYSEENSGQAGDPVKHTFQLASVVRTDIQQKPVAHSGQRPESVMRSGQQLKPVVQSVQHGDSVMNSGQRPELSVSSDQQPESVENSGQQIKRVVHSGQRREPLIHSGQRRDPVVPSCQQLDPIIHSGQRQEPVMHSGKRQERVVHSDQHQEPEVYSGRQQVPEVHSGRRLERVLHSGQQQEPLVHSGQKQVPMVHSGRRHEHTVHTDQQPQHVVHSGEQERETEADSPRRLLRRLSSEQNGGSFGPIPLREATEVLLNMERMKTEAKRDATAAINRLAGALEAIADRLGGPLNHQMASPPQARKRFVRTISSESD